MGQLALNTSVVHSSNMKFLVLSACVAMSSSQLVAYPNGAVAPLDTPDVHAAKVAFAAAGGVVHPGHGYAAAFPYGYAGHFGGLVGHSNGAIVPVDTPDVHAAKVAHAAAGGAVHVPEVAPYAYAAHPYAAAYPYAYGGVHAGYPVHVGYAGLVAHPNGAVVPVEPADVVAARNELLAAVAEA